MRGREVGLLHYAIVERDCRKWTRFYRPIWSGHCATRTDQQRPITDLLPVIGIPPLWIGTALDDGTRRLSRLAPTRKDIATGGDRT